MVVEVGGHILLFFFLGLSELPWSLACDRMLLRDRRDGDGELNEVTKW